MTYTIASDCSSIDVTSDLITAYIAALPSPDHTLQLKLSVDCETDYTIDLDDNNLDVGNNKYVITPSDVGNTTTISDNIIKATLTKTVTSSGAKTKEYSCIFVNCSTECEVLEATAADPNSKVGLFYWILKDYSGNCTKCKCEDACKIWGYLQYLLDNPEEDDCGCS